MRRPVCSGRSDPEWLSSGSLAGLREDSMLKWLQLEKGVGERRVLMALGLASEVRLVAEVGDGFEASEVSPGC